MVIVVMQHVLTPVRRHAASRKNSNKRFNVCGHAHHRKDHAEIFAPEIRLCSPRVMVENQFAKSKAGKLDAQVNSAGGRASGMERLRQARQISGTNANMSENNLSTLIAASAQALDLPVNPAWHSAIRFNLEVILRFATLVTSFPLPDDAEPAPVFRA